MADNRVLQWILKAKDEASAVLTNAERNATGFAGKIGTAFKALGAAMAALALGKFFKDSIAEAAQAEKGMARLGQAVSNAGGNFQALSPTLTRAIDGVRRLTTYSGGDLTDALTNMVTITGDVAGSTENLGLAADLAAARNIELSQAADVVAKAMNGNVTALNKLGIAGKDSTTAIANLRDAVGGFAQTDAQTFSGQLTKLNNGWKDFQEAVGLAILGTGQAGGALGGLTDILADVADWVEANSEQIGAFVDALFAIGRVVKDVLVGAFKLLRPVIEFSVTALGWLLDGLGRLVESGGSLLKKFGVNVDTTLGASLRAAGKSLQELTKQRVDAEKEVTAVTEAEVPKRVRLTKQETDARETATKALAKYRETVQLTADQMVGLTPKVVDTTGAVERMYPHTKKLVDEFVRLTAPAGPLDKLKAAPTTFPTSNALQRMAADAEAAKEKAVKLRDTIQDNIGAAVGFAQGLGAISDKAAAALQNATGLGNAIAGLFASGGNPLASLPGILGGLTGLIGGLFGGNKMDRARDELLRANAENTKALGKLTDVMSLQQSGSDIEKAQRLLASVFSQEGGKKARLAQGLASSGLSIKDLEELGQVFGVGIISGEGRLEFDALRQLFGQLNQAQFGVPATFSGQLDKISRGLSLGTLTKGDEFAQVIQALSLTGGGTSILGALRGADLSSEAGRGGLVDRLRGLFTDFTSSPLSASQLAGFTGSLTGREFLDTLDNLVKLLTDDVADSFAGLDAILGGGVGGVTTNGEPALDFSTAFSDFAETGTQQVGYLASIDASLATLVQRGSGGAGASFETIDEQLGIRLSDAQAAAGSAAR